jgi:nitrous oxidase accessory protein NosD
VAVHGDDSSEGTKSHPLATIAKAAMVADSGDTVWIEPGTYRPTDIIRPAHSGTAEAPIVFRAAAGGPVVIDGQGQVPNYDWDGVFMIDKKSWIVVDGLTVVNSRWFGICAMHSEGITVRNCSTRFTGGSGIYMIGTSRAIVSHNSVRRACDAAPSTPTKFTQECISMPDCTDFEIAYNEVFDRLVDKNMGGEGIDAKGECRRGKIHDNTVHDLCRIGVYMDSWNRLNLDIEIYSNTVYHCSSGITVACEEGGTSRDVRIYDNLVYDCSNLGIRLAGYLKNGPIQDVSIYQNTVARCGFHGNSWENCALLIEATNPANRNYEIRNNIFSDNLNQVRINGQTFLKFDHNLIHGSSLYYGEDCLEDDPLFVDPDHNDFHLKKASPARGAAIQPPLSRVDHDGRPRPSEGAVRAADMGAFQFR